MLDMHSQGRRLAVLVFHNALNFGGAERNLVLLGKYADKRMCKVSFLLSRPSAPIPDGVMGFENKVTCLRTPQIRQNYYTWPINLLLKLAYSLAWLWKHGRQFDFFIMSSLDEQLIMFLAKRCLKLPGQLLTFEQENISAFSQGSKLPVRLQYAIKVILHKGSDFVLCLSEGIRQDLQERHGVKTKMIIQYSCIDLKEIARLSVETIEEMWILKDNRKTVVYAGRLENRHKRIDVLLNAFANLMRKTRTEAKLLIIGDGTDRAYLEKLTKELKVEKDVYYLGWKTNPFKYYSVSNVLVLTSDFEGFGNVILEGMACGLPVISTDCPSGPAEILDGGKWGILVNRGDYLALAQSLERVLTDEGLSNELREKSRKRAEDFQYDKILNNFNSILERRYRVSR